MKTKYDEIIEVLREHDYGGEYDCAIENHSDVLKKYRVEDSDILEVCDLYGELTEHRCYFDEFLHDYYKSVIESVCNVLISFKNEENE